jgi:hypothetical protein
MHRPVLADDTIDRKCILDDDRVDESSGLAFSLRRPGYVWTHNDSGDKARLFAFDLSGKSAGQVELKSKMKVNDWEDMAVMVRGGVSQIVVADCGDNRAKRRSISLIIFDEPDPTRSTKLKRFQEIQVRYPDGAHDCEAIAVDADANNVLLFTKSALPICQVFAVEIPSPSLDDGPEDATAEDPPGEITARLIDTLAIPMVTGADIDQQSGTLWLSSYLGALRYPGHLNRHDRKNLSLRQQLAQNPIVVKLPAWKQIEAIAVDPSGDVWVTSEGKRAPLGRLKCLKLNKNSTSILPTHSLPH